MSRYIAFLLLTLALAGCGADVASTAATEAALEAQQAKQAQQLEGRVRGQLNAAMQTEQQRLRQAEQAAGE
jgi:PBP1b-binding outer membrane lipoprotein LpoB